MTRDPLRSVIWDKGTLWILDQRSLPSRVRWIRARDAETVAEAIVTLAVRGAPAIGIAAAYGAALSAGNPGARKKEVLRAIAMLSKTRPTGFNLLYALGRMRAVVSTSGANLKQATEAEAIRLHREDEASCLQMANHGSRLFKSKEVVLTYCHTGGPATGGIGTALGVIKTAFRLSKIAEVFACETRPVGQGARLTVWECTQSGIPVTLICDNMAGALMRTGKVDRVLVGADRITANGDTSNKIGTFGLAVLAFAHGIPFHIVAPYSTIDTSLSNGDEIRIEERPADEVTRATPGLDSVKGFRVWNPAFDVTPGKLVTSFVTDRGILRPPFSLLSKGAKRRQVKV